MNEYGNPRLRVSRGAVVPGRHPDVVLLGAEADLIMGLDGAKALVAPGPRKLT